MNERKIFSKIVILTILFFLIIFSVWIVSIRQMWLTSKPDPKEKEMKEEIKKIFSGTSDVVSQIIEALKTRYETF